MQARMRSGLLAAPLTGAAARFVPLAVQAPPSACSPIETGVLASYRPPCQTAGQ
ncbi:MAG: hypothetical protein HOQ29_04930 [Acidobacteria bacterium]|nr:hypothetical protein [Acidobacteriota bacterium]